MIRQGKDHADSSRTAAADHTTAAAIGKQYLHEFPASEDSDKRCDRHSDGAVASGAYVRGNERLVDAVTPKALQIDFHHPLENWLGRRPIRWLLRRLTRLRSDGKTPLERIFETYHDSKAPFLERLIYWPIHLFIDRMRGETDVPTFRQKLSEHGPTIRGLNITARSVGEYGLTIPQRFSAPLFAVWNITNRCNLACKHCYQDSEHSALDGELFLDEKLDLVDQMAATSMPMLAISGGEPMVCKDLMPVLRRASGHGMHLSLATNGTAITAAVAEELADAGVRYCEISLDSVDADRHDAFRGVSGMWDRAVAGARHVVASGRMRLGIAMCVHQGNFHEVRPMIDFAEKDIGASCFAHFNFIPVGRGLKMVSGDITPSQREQLLAILNEKMQADGIGVISTAPQLGRVCLAGTVIDGDRMTCSHAGAGSGVRARVVAKYLGGCGAGRTYVCIEPGGDVTPCVYIPHRVMGNVREKPFVEIYRDSVFWDILNDRDHRLHHCEVCAFKQYCGGCRARADAYFGQLHAGDPGCIFNEKHWQRLVADGVAVVPDDLAPESMDLPAMRHGPA